MKLSRGWLAGLRRALGAIFVFLVPLAFSVAAYFAAVDNYNAGQASQKRQAAAEAAAQQRQGAQLEAKLCATLGPLAGLAGLRPPAGNPADNPSRAFEQQLVVKLAPLAQLGPDLGCDKTRRTP
jgi:hypothetical protein